MASRRQISGAHQQGMSLVEIMVALALGAFITVGIIQMFTANRTTYDVNMGQARLQENARFAMEFLAAPVRMAGYTGCSARAEVFNALNPVGGQQMSEFDMSDPITGHAATGPTSWSPPLSALPSGIDNVAPGTDVLIVKSVLGDGMRLAQDMPNSSANVFTVMPNDPDDPGLEDGGVLMISDCSRATVFQITATAEVGTAGNERFRITHNTGGSVAPGNSTQRLAQDDVGFRRDAAVYMLNTEYFFIAPGIGTNNRGGNPLSLWRKRGVAPAEELVEGIEALLVLYGEDTNNDRSPNRYRQIHEVVDRNNIVTVRVTVRANSVDEVVEQGDGLLRRDFTKTIALRNRL